MGRRRRGSAHRQPSRTVGELFAIEQPLLWSPIGALWLVTTAERTRAARRQRLVAGGDAARRRIEALVARDQLIGARLRSAPPAAGHTVIEVPTAVDWDHVVAVVREAITTATAPFARLRPGQELSWRRRHENDVVHRQIVAHERHIGAALPSTASSYGQHARRSPELTRDGPPGRIWRLTVKLSR